MIVLRDKEYSVRSVLRHLGRGIGTAISQTKANIGARLNSGDIKIDDALIDKLLRGY